MTTSWIDSFLSARVYDLEQPRFAGMPIHPAHQPGYFYALHRRHRDTYQPEAHGPRSGASGVLTMMEHSGTHLDALCHQASELKMFGGVAVEQAEMIRGKRLRPLAAVADKPLEIEGYGTIEPITRTIDMKIPTNYFGVFIPKGVPPEVVATVDRVWGDHIMRSEALKKYATSRGALFAPMSGQDAQKAAMPAVQANAWLLHAGGKTKVSPDTVGIYGAPAAPHCVRRTPVLSLPV